MFTYVQIVLVPSEGNPGPGPKFKTTRKIAVCLVPSRIYSRYVNRPEFVLDAVSDSPTASTGNVNNSSGSAIPLKA